MAESERKYLTSDEVERLLEATKRGRHPERDHAMVLVAFKHGLRVSELCDLRWSDVDTERDRLLIRRLKSGRSANHPLSPEVKAALSDLKQSNGASQWVFNGERGGRMTRQNFGRIIKEAAKTAAIAINCTPHRLRHACGFALADRGVDMKRIQLFMGHASIASTALYTDLAANALEGIWLD